MSSLAARTKRLAAVLAFYYFIPVDPQQELKSTRRVQSTKVGWRKDFVFYQEVLSASSPGKYKIICIFDHVLP